MTPTESRAAVRKPIWLRDSNVAAASFTAAAIVTVDERGFIELANRAAAELIVPRDGHLVGNPIAAFLPELHHALRWEEGPQFRTSMQCRGHRGNGESFTADVWFSTYKEGTRPKLRATKFPSPIRTAALHYWISWMWRSPIGIRAWRI